MLKKLNEPENPTFDEENEDDIEYEEVEVESDSDPVEEEDLMTTLEKVKQHQKEQEAIVIQKREPKPEITKKPEVIDDFIRNFLVKSGLKKTLEVFQNEWYELQQKGKQVQMIVPDAYLHNTELENRIRDLEMELQKEREIVKKVTSTWDKLRKERDYHRMHHNRVLQEKNSLVKDVKRMKGFVSKYEPTIAELQKKYEKAMKEKMLIRMERDKLAAKLKALEESAKPEEPKEEKPKERKKKHPQDSILPTEDRMNPFLSRKFSPIAVENFSLLRKFEGCHSMSISGLALHPKKNFIATCSDDSTWKLWEIPSGKIIMSGIGHKDWVSSVAFHPAGTHLASSSGDKTVKLWNFATNSCSVTFSEHTQVVWACNFHDTGNFLVSASMDHTAKMWDINSMRCRTTFRGHIDSVNHVEFQPFTNYLVTCSGDKTVSLWDANSGICVQTFYGHPSAVNHATFSLVGDTIASSDADGNIIIWDVRMCAERGRCLAGPHPANKIAFDPSGEVLVASSDDTIVRVFDTLKFSLKGELRGHQDAVQCVLFGHEGRFLITGGSDCIFNLWQ